jgi:hypothetical protein
MSITPEAPHTSSPDNKTFSVSEQRLPNLQRKQYRFFHLNHINYFHNQKTKAANFKVRSEPPITMKPNTTAMKRKTENLTFEMLPKIKPTRRNNRHRLQNGNELHLRN